MRKHLLLGLLWGWWFWYLFEPTSILESALYFGFPMVCFSFFYNRADQATFWGIPFALPSEKNRSGKRMEKRETIRTTQEFYRRLKDITFPKEVEQQYTSKPRATVLLRKSMILVKETGKEGGRRVGALLLLFRYQFKLHTKLLIVTAFCLVWGWWTLPDHQQIEEVREHVQLICRKGYFILTQQSFEDLKRMGASDEIVQVLQPLEKQKFLTQQDFLKKIETKIGVMQTRTYKKVFVKQWVTSIAYDETKYINDLYIPLKQIPTDLQQALVYKEDRRFYTHWSWDWRGKMRAFVRDLQYAIPYFQYRVKKFVLGDTVEKSPGSFEGGSTITQQLAKNLFLSVMGSKNPRRFFKVWLLGFKLERYYDKATILEMYLNKVSFGLKCYGIEVASRTYFGKHAANLQLYEAAILIQSLTDPERNNFKTDEQAARSQAQKNVLEPLAKELAKAEKLMLGPETLDITLQQICEASEALKGPITYGTVDVQKREARFLRDWILPQIENAPYFAALPEEFTVVTTLHAAMQAYAEEVMKDIAIFKLTKQSLKKLRKEGIPENIQNTLQPIVNQEFIGKEEFLDAVKKQIGQEQTVRYEELILKHALTDNAPYAAALVALAPDGAVRALIGSRDYVTDQYCKATLAKRQPGSTFKLFTYLAALTDLHQGWQPDALMSNRAVECPDSPVPVIQGRKINGSIPQQLTLREALAQSQNPAAIRLFRSVGKEQVFKLAQDLGIPTESFRAEKSECNIALGGGKVAVTLLQLTKAYAALANGGSVVTPYGILGIRTQNGTILYWHKPTTPQQILPQSRVATMNDMLMDVVENRIKGSTGRNANFSRDYEIAGKTGTTDDYCDAWFIGFTTHLTTGVWVGNNDNSPMHNVSGGTLPAQIFAKFMGKTHAALQLPPQPLP